MMIYCAARFKPKKKRKAKGVVARKYSRSSAILGVEKLPSLSYGPRVGADAARSIESLDTNLAYTEKRESLKYTGTLVKGIATMHKSNAVPVIDEEQMKDISRMRRG
jgi:hypothetical protein